MANDPNRNVSALIARQDQLKQRLNAFYMEAHQARRRCDQLKISLEINKGLLQDTLAVCYMSQLEKAIKPSVHLQNLNKRNVMSISLFPVTIKIWKFPGYWK